MRPESDKDTCMNYGQKTSDVPGEIGPSDSTIVPKHLRSLARFLDESLRLPGGYRIGYDGIIGLVPGVGDVVGLMLSAYVVAAAAKLGVAKSVLIRMCANVAIETIVGTIPLIGDLFDFVFKANSRNLALIDRHGVARDATSRLSVAWLFALGTVILLTIAAVVFLVIRVIAEIIALF